MDGKYFDRKNKIQDLERIIVVEGPDDGYFLDAVLTNLGIPESRVRVLLALGKDNIGATLRPLLKSHSFTTGKIGGYAVIRDADGDPAAAEKEVHNFLTKASEPTPASGQTVGRADGRKVGLFLFPDVGQPGDLETLCMSTATGPIVAASAAYLATAASNGGNADHHGKRLSQSYLAASSKPLCNGAGYATSKGAFDVTHAKLNGLRNFLADFLA